MRHRTWTIPTHPCSERRKPSHPTPTAHRLPRIVLGMLVFAGTVSTAFGQVAGPVWWWGDWLYREQAWVPPLGVSVAAEVGIEHAIAVDANGRVSCWGVGFQPMTGPPGYPSVTGSHLTWGQCRMPGDLGPVVDVAAGDFHTLVLGADGIVRAWGKNEVWWNYWFDLSWHTWTSGECDVPPDLPPIARIAAGGEHSMAIDESGVVHCWGKNGVPFLPDWKHPPPPYAYPIGQCDVPLDLGPAIEIAGGYQHSVALESEGGVRCWGAGTASPPSPSPPIHFGQSIVPADLGPAADIAAGRFHTIALLADGTVRCWGAGTTVGVSPHFGQSIVPANLGRAIDVAAGDYFSAALLADGSIRRWGKDLGPACTIPAEESPFIEISARGDRLIARRADGRIRIWNACSPQTRESVPGDHGVPVDLDAGESHVLVLFEDGSMTATGPWGYWALNPDVPGGPLWVGSPQRTVPPMPEPAIDIACGDRHNLAILASGHVVAWGTDCDFHSISWDPPVWTFLCWGALAVPEDLPPARAVAGGHRHSVALLRDGTVRCWGEQESGACTPPEDLGPVTAIAAGDDFTVAIETGGRLRYWGFADTDEVLKDLPPAVRVTAKGNSFAAVFHDGTIRAWERNGLEWTLPPDLMHVVEIDMSTSERLLVLLPDGSLRCVSRYSTGGATCEIPPALPSVAKIAAGTDFGVAIAGDPQPLLPGDLNGDGWVDGADLSMLLARWGRCPEVGPCVGDLDRNGQVDGADLAALLSDWLS